MPGVRALVRASVQARCLWRNSAAAVCTTTQHGIPLSLLSQRWRSSTPTPQKPPRKVVQVLRHEAPAKSYVQVEEDIAFMQREIRDAYK